VNGEPKSEGSSSKPWHGLLVVFTGSIASLARSQAQDAAKQLMGAKATPGSISMSTDIVVYGGKGGKKLDQAILIQYNTNAMQ
jgi:NAD-dependent DNA ligase